MRTPEGKIKDKVKATLAAHGAYQFWPVPMGFGKRTLDCLACHHGRFLAVETKRAGKDLTPFQKNTKGEMRKAGAFVVRVSNDDELEILCALLETIEQSHRTDDDERHPDSTYEQG